MSAGERTYAHRAPPAGLLPDSGNAVDRHRRPPDYEGLDGRGLPCTRPGRCIAELPTTEERGRALEAATLEIANALNTVAQRRIGFGTPVHVAFGITRQAAKNHGQATLLLMKGDSLPLAWCGYLTP